MGWESLVLYGILLTAAGAFVLRLYRVREPRVRGFVLMAILRILTLAIVLLLVFDPAIPAAISDLGPGRRWVLVDGSKSMAAPEGGASAWARIQTRAEITSGDDPVVVFGDDPRVFAEADAEGSPPFGASRLTPALERAAESGAKSVLILSDLRIEDVSLARSMASQLGLGVDILDLGGEVRSAGVESLEVGFPLERDEPASATVEVFAVGAEGDSAVVELRAEDRLVAQGIVALPDEGRRTRLELELPPPPGEGEVRYTARVLLDGDAFPDDDERIVYADVRGEEGNLVLISLHADWELRFLLPVLERATGLTGRGFFTTRTGRFVPIGMDGTAGVPGMEAVQRMAQTAEILVIQAASELPTWLGEALANVSRGILLARGPAAALPLVTTATARPGEWYVSPEISTSPLAGELSGLDFSELPPLSELLPLSGPPPGAAPLTVQLRGSGAAEPGILLVPSEEGRWAVALTSGFWRWALRPDQGRDHYERLWSGVAGWLLADEAMARVPGVRPIERVVPAREPIAWVAPRFSGERVSVRLTRNAVTLTDTMVIVPQDGRFYTPDLEPGTYTYVAATSDGSSEWRGRLDMTRWTSDLGYPRDTTLALAGETDGATVLQAAPGRPLRTHPLPYLVVITLLCAEWIIRRRRGLR
jgi:hypothetical protein